MGPDYEKIASLLSANNIYNSVSELHGVLCGQICTGAKGVKLPLTQQLMGLEDPFSPILEQLITRLGTTIGEQVSGGEFVFQPLLPDDEEEIGIRLRALAEWCENFNIGFGGSFGKGDQSLLEETREVLKDFAAFAEIDDSPGDTMNTDEMEDNEASYMEIVEYIRMAVSTVYMQNSGVTGADSGAGSLGGLSTEDDSHGNDGNIH